MDGIISIDIIVNNVSLITDKSFVEEHVRFALHFIPFTFFLFLACNCHNHSDTCVFNQTVANMNASLNMLGQYSGGGVCQQCQDQTTGINCESCKTLYYNPSSVDIRSKSACQLCACNVNGSRKEPGYQFLDCVKQDNNALNMTVGDCFCKSNVNGSKCDQCKVGFYNLTTENPNGCNACHCSTIGTKPFDTSCSQETGQCHCKSNVAGLKCDACQDGFYNFSASNLLGCDDCMCNLGGSKSHSCNKLSGNCFCHVNTIINKKCDGVADEYYYPSLHFMQDTSLVRSSQIVMAWQGSLRILGAQTRNYFKFVFQCSSRVSVDAIITYSGGSNNYLSDQIKIDETCRDCYLSTANEVVVDSNQISVDIMFPSVSSNSFVSCSKFIAVPKQFYNSSAIPNPEEFYKYCNVMTNNVSHEICYKSLFTLTMDYLHRPFPCNCNLTGAFNNSCVEYMGQCSCKPGVTGRICNRCEPGFYNFTQTGCTPCNCFGINKVCDDVTGQCVCPRNTEGRTCNTCTEFHWNVTESNGCQPCNCSSTGAANGRCDATTGQCECRNGVEGRECHTCSAGYKQFSPEGCKPCNCSSGGSLSGTCDSSIGQCPCKDNTIGLLCNQCKTGTFSLENINKEGCLNCYCMGITDNCTMASGSRIRIRSNISNWAIGKLDQIDDSVPLSIGTRTVGGLNISIITANLYTYRQALFWITRNDFFGHFGVTAYGGVIEWYSELTIDEARITRKIPSYVILKVGINLAEVSIDFRGIVRISQTSAMECRYKFVFYSLQRLRVFQSRFSMK